MARRSKRRKSFNPLPWVVGLALVVVAGGFGWYVVTRQSSAPEAAAVCTLVIDRTKTAETEENRQNFLGAADITIDGCRRDAAVLTIYRIDGSTGRSEQVGGTFEFFDADQKKDVLLVPELDQREEEAREIVRNIMDAPEQSGGGSEILAALEETAKASRAAFGNLGVPQYMVLLTDGLQNSPGNGVRIWPVVDGEVSGEELASDAVDSGLAPSSLQGMLVSMVGVRAGENYGGRPIDAATEGEIEAFWRSTLQSVGARVCFYGKQVPVLPQSC